MIDLVQRAAVESELAARDAVLDEQGPEMSTFLLERYEQARDLRIELGVADQEVEAMSVDWGQDQEMGH